MTDQTPTARITSALLDAHRAGDDVAELLADALARAAAALGSTEVLLTHRPGSWEAADVRHLLAGTVGPDDEHLPAYRAD